MIDRLYLLNSALLLTHEVDSAYWKEWELFHLPGGIQLFDLLNFALILVVLVGFKLVLLRKKSGYFFSLLISLSGIAAFVIHGTFMLFGFSQFLLPVSLLILVSWLVVSIAQLIFTLKNRHLFISA